MKIKHLVIVSLILAILTIGAASASEDVMSDDELAASDIAENSFEEVAVDEDIDELQSVDEEEVLGDLSPDDFNVQINESIDLAKYDDDSDEAEAITFNYPDGAEGEIKVLVWDDDPEYPMQYNFELYDSPITLGDMGISSVGTYNVKVSYIPNEGDPLDLKSGTITVTRTLSQDDFYYELGPDYESDNEAITSKYETILSFKSYRSEGTLYVYVNGKKCYNKTLESYDTIHVNSVDLGITENDTYEISFKFVADDGQEVTFESESVPVDVVDWSELDDDYVSIYDRVDILDRSDSIAYVSDYEGVGTVTLFIDGKQYFTKTFTASNYIEDVELSIADLNIYNNFATGIHRVKLVYNKNNTKEYVAEKNVDFYAYADIDCPDVISAGEKENIIITFLKGTTGTVTAYYGVKKVDEDFPEDYSWERGDIFKTVNIINGVATIPLDSLPKGEYNFFLNISSSTNDGERSVYINVRENTAGITASVSASEITVGNDVVVKFNGPVSEEEKVYIYLDDKEIASSLPRTGALSQTISGLTVGQHKINVYFDDGDKFYSNTFYVTVKEKSVVPPAKKADKITLTLKKVKVKRSAKKLVLQATLKVNGKAPKKGTKVTFKFNGKTYKAKTNAKGVAKVTIKKKVLKKLKVGKKVKYQVSYGKTTKKLTVKVKK